MWTLAEIISATVTESGNFDVRVRFENGEEKRGQFLKFDHFPSKEEIESFCEKYCENVLNKPEEIAKEPEVDINTPFTKEINGN